MSRFAWLLALALLPLAAPAEYGDVVLNKRAEKEGMKPVVFPHWFHRIRFRCKVCHAEFGFAMRAGGNDMLMTDMLEGRFCGRCHDGNLAWGLENCQLCHTGKAGLPTGIQGGHSTKGPGHW